MLRWNIKQEKENRRMMEGLGVGVMLQMRNQGGPHRGRDIWQKEHGRRSRGRNKLRNSKEVTVAGTEEGTA